MRAQSVEDWDIVIVDDGSADATADLARDWAGRDSRINLVQQENAGASAARNSGMKATTATYVVFLDSDDWVSPDFLKKLLPRVTRRKLDGAFCAAVDVDEHGERGKYWHPVPRQEFFNTTAHDCPIAVHCGLLRRSLILEVGGWDETLKTCEDWDLWQRLARSKGKFANTSEVLAFIRLRAGSLSRSAAHNLAADGAKVIRRGHQPDARVPDPDPQWAEGTPPDAMAHTLAMHLIWAAILDIATGGSGKEILDDDCDFANADITPYGLASTIHDAISHGTGELQSNWSDYWPRITDLLETIEDRCGDPKLKQRTLRLLETLVFRHAHLREPTVIGGTYWTTIDVIDPISSLDVPTGHNQVSINVYRCDKRFGTVTLDVRDGHVAAQRILDAVAERMGGRIAAHILRKKGWDALPLMGPMAKTVFRRSFVRFAGYLSQLEPASRRAALRQFAILHGEEMIKASGILRTAEEPDADTPTPSPANAMSKNRQHTVTVASDYGTDYWEGIFSTQDPWDYTNTYEQTKYQQTIDALPNRRFGRGLELACAEGHFTQLIAPLVDELVATDISETAVQRAAEACSAHTNIQYQTLDLIRDPVPGKFDLIICSEVLYYFERGSEIRSLAARLQKHLNPGGLILMAHGNVAAIRPEETGFEWGHNFDARSIGKIFADTDGLRLVKEFRSDLYRIQLLETTKGSNAAVPTPALIDIERAEDLNLYVSSQIEWNGCARFKQVEVTDRLPILMYHRVANKGNPGLDPYRVTPEQFDMQMRYLADNGYHGITLDAWQRSTDRCRGVPGRAVLITFDDGYVDFREHAWPILQKYGFPATVFVVPGLVGKDAEWDSRFGPPAPLMNWDQIRELVAEGVQIGSHTMTHPLLTTLSHDEVASEALMSKTEIEQQIGHAVDTIAYPYGDHSEIVERIFEDNGYAVGVTTSGKPANVFDRHLRIGRMELSPTDGPDEMRGKLPAPRQTNVLRHRRVALKQAMRQFHSR